MAGVGDGIPVFRARGLAKTYTMGEVQVPALRGVDLDLWPGQFVVLLGASGSGKSTLLNILGGLDVPSAGEVECRGHRLTGAGEAAMTRFRREHVGVVFQFYNLIPSLTAREDVLRVPSSALYRDAGGWAVFRIEDGRARRVAVQTGLQGGGWSEVSAGLAAGDRVVVHPDRSLADGARLRLR